jgi:hypothetical protein
MYKKSEDITEIVEKRFQMVMVLILFLPVTLEAVFSLSNDPDEFSKFLLKYGVAIFSFLLCYMFIESRKNKVEDRILLWIKYLLWIAIGSIGYIFYFIASIAQQEVITVGFKLKIGMGLYVVSLWTLILVPVFIILIFLTEWIWSGMKEINSK